jgi:hypothetical protein
MENRFLKTTSLGIPAVLAMCSVAASAQTLHLVSANAQLVQNVDTRSAKPGQAVTAKLTSAVKGAGSTELPKGTLLIGKVEEVQAAAGKEPTKLSLVFDQAKLSDGHTVAIKTTLLSAYPGDTNEYFAETGSTGSLGNQLGVIAPDQTIDQEPGFLGNVALHSAVKEDASGVFTSTDKSIDLRRGTAFQLAIAPEGATTAAANGQ